MIAIIAEKPSVGMDIARVVGADTRNDGYCSGNGYMVTWALGHLVSLAIPDTYGYTKTAEEDLPMLPDPFRLVSRQMRTDRGMVTDIAASKQLKVIESVFNRCDSIVVATDAGREGELIFRWIYDFLGCTKPFRRLWISSLTDEAIRKRSGGTEGRLGIRQPVYRRRQPREGRLAGGHERQPCPGHRFRLVQQLDRTGADSDARHDMQPLQGEPQFRIHTILAAACHPQWRHVTPPLLPSRDL